MASLAVDRERIRALEGRLADLEAEVESSRERAGALEAERAELRSELSSVRAHGDATIMRLQSELSAAREAQAEAAAQHDAAGTNGHVPADDLVLDDLPPRVSDAPGAPIDPDLDLDAETEAAHDPAPQPDLAPQPDPAPRHEPAAAEPEHEGDPVACTACDATGTCDKCSGRGKRFGMRCAECEGSGICTTCGGPGYVWPGEEAAPHDPRHY
jgi:hypothetical protein